MAFQPSNPLIRYCVGKQHNGKGRIVKSINGGMNWFEPRTEGQYAISFFEENDLSNSTTDVVIANNAESSVIVGLSKRTAAHQIYRSDDQGVTFYAWDEGISGVDLYRDWTHIDHLVSSADGMTFYTFRNNFLYKRGINEASWTRIPEPAGTGRWIAQVITHPTQDGTLYLTHYGFGVYKSEDYGATWTNFPVIGDRNWWLAISPDGEQLTVVDGYDHNQHTHQSLYSTNNEGQTWETLTTDGLQTPLRGIVYLNNEQLIGWTEGTGSAIIRVKNEVATGVGSYHLDPPPNGAVPQDRNGQNANPKVIDGFDKPIQTNDWWSSLLYKYTQNETFLWEIHSWKLFAHPLSFVATRYGLDVKYPDQATVAEYQGWTDAKYQYAMSNQDFTIGVDGLDMGVTDTVKTADYGDWHVTAEWKDSNGKMLQATMAHGSPYAFFETNSDDVYLRFLFGHTIDNTIGSNIIGFTTQGHHYALFAPTGTSWNTNASYTFDENNLVNASPNSFAREAFTCDLEGKHYFSIAVLPDNSLATLQEFANHAYAFIDKTEVAWDYNASTSQLTNIFTVQTTVKEGSEYNTLQALYPHQWKNTNAINTNHIYQSARGLMKVVSGNSFTTTLKNKGILPVLPPVLSETEKTTLYQFIEDEYAVTNTYVTNDDTYWQGKRFGRQADLIHIADQVGHTTARDKFLADLKAELEDWFTAEEGESNRGYFYYDQQWNTLIGYPASFGSDTHITDHHFHYGYFIKAAATIARFDPNWIADNQWGSMVKLLIKDVSNWDRTDTMFPFLRCFDAYAGHSWANGHGSSHWGNDQEASSESINFAAWVYALGLYTNDNSLRDLGLFLYLNEAEAATHYWFDKDQEIFPNSYGYQTASRIWGNGADKIVGATFEAESEYQLGINTFPIQAPLLYLGCDTSTIMKAHQEADALGDGVGDLWEDIMWGYLAMARPAEALADYQNHTSGNYYYNTNAPWLPNVNGIYEDFSDFSLAPAQIYHWLHALNHLGVVDTSVFADYPAAIVFTDGDHKHYIVDNPTNNDLTVNFSDGKSVVATANAIFSETVIINTCPPLLEFTDENISGDHQAQIIRTIGNVSVTTEATLKAEQSIELQSGFSVTANTPFHAVIDDCVLEANRQAPFLEVSSKPLPVIRPMLPADLLIFPNPFEQATTIQYTLSSNQQVNLTVYNSQGQFVEQILKQESQEAGTYQYVFRPSSKNGNLFIVVLQMGDAVLAEKVLVIGDK